jgi:hypothetical protein
MVKPFITLSGDIPSVAWANAASVLQMGTVAHVGRNDFSAEIRRKKAAQGLLRSVRWRKRATVGKDGGCQCGACDTLGSSKAVAGELPTLSAGRLAP